MNNLRLRKFVLIAAGLAMASAAALTMTARTLTASESDPAVMEAYLKTARVVSIDKSGTGGRTAPWILTLNDGTVERRAIFKYIDRRRPAFLPDSFHYELAAYELSKLVKLPIVPPVVERTIDTIPGSLQLFLEDCEKLRDLKRRGIAPPDPAGFGDALAEIRIFENLVFNECENLEDTFIHKDDWRICRVDFSEAFPPEPDLIPGCEIARCSRSLYATLQSLDRKKLQEALGMFLAEDELRALEKRRERILGVLEALIKDKGEAAVLFGLPPAKEK
jgi:hypothetical protein